MADGLSCIRALRRQMLLFPESDAVIDGHYLRFGCHGQGFHSQPVIVQARWIALRLAICERGNGRMPDVALIHCTQRRSHE